jgi:hypothetical protein
MAVLVHVVDAMTQHPHPHGCNADLGLAVEGVGLALANYGPKALSATEVVKSVHGQAPE